jgi:hypothetical protein
VSEGRQSGGAAQAAQGRPKVCALKSQRGGVGEAAKPALSMRRLLYLSLSDK